MNTQARSSARRFDAPLHDGEFRDAIKKAAISGFETNESVLAIHTFVLNIGTIDLFENMLCSKRRVNLPSFVVFAVDPYVCERLERAGHLSDPGHVCLNYMTRMVQQIKVADPEAYVLRPMTLAHP